MPMVGTKKFAYTPKGKKEAKEQSMKTGKPGTKGAPTAAAFKAAAKTAKKK
jgi:hypothetical protein